MKPYHFFSWGLMIMLFVACQNNEIDFDPTPSTNSIRATVDGVEVAISGITVTGNYTENSNWMQTLTVGGARTNPNGQVEGISLVMISADTTGIMEGDTYTATSLAKRGSGLYYIDNSPSDISATSLNSDVATITITKLDYTEKLVSGIFSFEGVDDDQPNQTYQVIDGEFTDVSFD
ncbi:hypothetical protein [Pontibacter sp. G13]|uniref:hypothetical protein n=1 Tax=Pontibacter sp. G13 TaxID=3074898 RepID=UPI00288AF138|nr:hypothetical protein [Pontibacter sp. G13]WNJ20355.1 hypothetical protein RJD25_07730 [Pontibacter sp. G13]